MANVRRSKKWIGFAAGLIGLVMGAGSVSHAQTQGKNPPGPGQKLEDGEKAGNGGDECERKILQIRDELAGWIAKGPKGLKLPAGLTMDRYLQEMGKFLEPGTVSVSCTTREIAVGVAQKSSTEDKTCRNFFSGSTPRIECNIDRFMNQTSLNGQVRLIHHEYASLTGFERTGDYAISDQLGGYSRTEQVVRLSITPIAKDPAEPEFLPVPGKDFEMMKTEVTQLQWYAVMRYNPSYFQKPGHCKGEHSPTDQKIPGYEGFVGCADHPVEQLSAVDADRFAVRLSMKPGADYLYFLPSEEDWGYVARAGTTTDYSFQEGHDGNDPKYLLRYAWYSVNSDGQTQRVGRLLPNRWGFHDMAGNVFEWTSSSYFSYRVFRGGSWNNNAQYLRSANRVSDIPSSRITHVGFRLVRIKL